VDSFSEGVWDIVIYVATLGGIAGLFFFIQHYASGGAGTDKPESMGHVWDGDLAELNNPLPRWWLNLFYITLAFGVVYLVLYPGLGSNDMALGWTQIRQYEAEVAKAKETYGPLFEKYRGTPIATLAGDAQALGMGQRLFSSYCRTCHGADAKGVPGFPNLTDRDWLYGGEPETIEKTILDGRSGMMPAWRDALGGDDAVHAVAQYVLSLGGRQFDVPAAARGKVLFAQFCVACHTPAGTGNLQVGAPNLTDDVWLYGASPSAIETSIGGGRQGRMPSHREFLGEAKVHLLAAYVYSLSR